jgi:hypothetical protein
MKVELMVARWEDYLVESMDLNTAVQLAFEKVENSAEDSD